MRTSTCAPLVALAIAVNATADAGEPPSVDEELSVTITVVGRAAESETATQTSIDATRIEASDARSVSDLLWAVPGARALRAGGRSGFSTVQVRGGDPNFTLVLLDGVPLNDPTDPEGGAFDLESLPAQALESAAIVRGPLSAYLGSAGLAGALDLRSRSADAETS